MKKIFSFTLIVVATASILYSCRDNIGVSHPQQYMTVYMPRAHGAPPANKIIISDTTYSFPYSAYLGGPVLPKNDIHISFSVVPTAVDSFNVASGTNYSLLPKESYTIGSKNAVIAAGHNSTDKLTLSIKANSNTLKLQTYLLPLSITKAEGTTASISKSLGTTYFIFQTSYRNFDKSKWSILGFDSQAPVNFPATALIDGNDDTFWNTDWDPVDPLPHYISVDMGKSHVIHGFILITGNPAFPQQKPKHITIKFSDDGKVWRDEEDFTLPFPDISKTRILLSHTVKARYYKIIVHTNAGKTQVTDLAEVHVF